MVKEKIKLETFLKGKEGTLLALSIFILITLEIVSTKLLLWQVFGLFSAFIAYILMLNLISGLKEEESSGVHWFKIFTSLFITGFCGFVLVNILPALIGDFIIVPMILTWLVLMIIPGIKLA